MADRRTGPVMQARPGGPDGAPPVRAPAGAGGSLRPTTVLVGHVFFTLMHSLMFANIMWLIPMLVRLRFGSENAHWRDWQTTLITAALPTFMISSIFWAELMRRMELRRYLLLYWFVGVFPFGCVGFVQNYGQLLLCHVAACAGLAGWNPAQGTLLKHFYSDRVRGRAFGILSGVNLGSSVVTVFLVGAWLEADPDAFRIFFPAAAVLQFVGLSVLIWLTVRTGAEGKQASLPARTLAGVLRPIAHMRATLRADRTFLRYEVAFMNYGAAFMFCDALLPVLATERLGMRYEDYAHSTQVALKVVQLALVLPMGWLLDRIGPIRTSGLSFGLLAFYPIVLIFATGPGHVALASGVAGMAMAGVMMGWMLGPVALAPTPEKVPQYAAIHATMVGIRGVIFQGLGMALYKLSGTFALPLGLATLALVFSAAQMWRLQGSLRRERRVAGVESSGARTKVSAALAPIPAAGQASGAVVVPLLETAQSPADVPTVVTAPSKQPSGHAAGETPPSSPTTEEIGPR